MDRFPLKCYFCIMYDPISCIILRKVKFVAEIPCRTFISLPEILFIQWVVHFLWDFIYLF